MKLRKEDAVKFISNKLLLEGSFVNSLGLLNGRMAIAIYFFYYAQITHQVEYREFALELIDEICGELHLGMPLNFAEGLAGIGWGIALLIQEKFIDADEDDILEEIDNHIISLDLSKIQENGINTGIAGIVQYAVARKNIDKNYILTLMKLVNERNIGNKDHYILLLRNAYYAKNGEAIFFFKELVQKTHIDQYNLSFNRKNTYGIINQGYAGIGLKLLLSDIY